MASQNDTKKRHEQFLDFVKGRRTIRKLGRRAIQPDKETADLIKAVVRDSPTGFNMQSSRVVIIFGQEHDDYWSTDAVTSLRETTEDDEKFERGKNRLQIFQKAHGTAIFFEDLDEVKKQQQKIPAFVDLFPLWSHHGTGMAQVNVWTALEAAGFGANLQHYNFATEERTLKRYNLPASWKMHAELVFGSPEGEPEPPVKEYRDDEGRFFVFGAQ